jgi:putative membrane protein
MSRVTSYWIWGENGSYYGMPWTNLLGWAVTGFILLVMLRQLAPEPKGDFRFSILVYLINFLLPLGFCVLNGYWLAVLAGSGSIVAAFLIFGSGKASRLPQPAAPELSSQPHTS